MAQEIKAVKRGNKGEVLMLELSSGVVLDTKGALYMARSGQIKGAKIQSRPFSAEELIMVDTNIPELQ